ncbi:MAG: phosphocholine cytidylyltransferase family protein [Actinomycetota bacterium]|nr:phosphocholine cytidylyltransferase family protein [Euzebyales bacterium]MDQ3342486.1 phosphocholine cytidylyltransferase family protein [Actinomycetota bacterium]MDQ3529911.1 phosphocholine cytidylyltransferase family protein [Actinomycetota bacterium]
MIGVVLAAGGGMRLRPLTDDLPKTLLPVDGDRSILELALRNLRAVGISEVVIVTGHAADAIERRVPELEKTYDVSLRTVFNDHHHDWNNAYSLWLARHELADGGLLVNGDTVHPAAVERRLLEARGAAPIMLALDDHKSLAEEEMKVLLDGDDKLLRINKALDPDAVHGEYIGVTLIESAAVPRLAQALQATYERDTTLYYEDGYQQYADWGETIRTAAIGAVDWVEVDNHDDLNRARVLAPQLEGD